MGREHQARPSDAQHGSDLTGPGYVHKEFPQRQRRLGACLRADGTGVVGCDGRHWRRRARTTVGCGSSRNLHLRPDRSEPPLQIREMHFSVLAKVAAINVRPAPGGRFDSNQISTILEELSVDRAGVMVHGVG